VDIIWAPQREKYIKSVAMSRGKCFLCEVVKQKNDKKNFVLKRGRSVFCILNRYPYNAGHLMVAPFSHLSDLDKLPEATFKELFQLTKEMTRLLSGVLKPDGFNIGINLGKVAGAGVPGHLHIHIVPRWNGDTNFMPVVAKTKIVGHSLSKLYNTLSKEIG